MVEKRKAYKLDLVLYVPPEGSDDPVLVVIGPDNGKGFDLCVDGKNIREALADAGGVIETHIEVADERDIDIWKEVEFLSEEDWKRIMNGEDL